MVPYMKAGGKITKVMAKEELSMLMEMSTMECGWMTKLMDMVFIYILMEPSMKGIGKRINNMDKELKIGQTVPSMMGSMSMVKSTDQEVMLGLMAALILDLGRKIIFKVTGLIIGQMEDNSWELG